MTIYRGEIAVTNADGHTEPPRPGGIEPAEDALRIALDGGAARLLAYTNIDDLVDDDHTLRLTLYTGRRYDLSMLGPAHGQVLAEVSARRQAGFQRDLLLTGLGDPEDFPGAVFDEGGSPSPAGFRLFDDLLVVMPERGTMWGLPLSFVEDVTWDGQRYLMALTDDEGIVHRFGRLAKRSEEFLAHMRGRMASLSLRTAGVLDQLIPGLDPDTREALAGAMRDGRAVQQRIIDPIDPRLWPRLEDAVVGTDELRASYEALASTTPSGWAALGVKAPRAPGPGVASEDEPPDRFDAEAGPPTSDRPVSWFFCPLASKEGPVNVVAQEVTSEAGHATYLFRLMEPERFASLSGRDLEEGVSAGIRRLNRALVRLNFRREPIYLSDEQIEQGGGARYRVALRKLDHVRWARQAFLGRAIHGNEASWRAQVDAAMASHVP